MKEHLTEAEKEMHALALAAKTKRDFNNAHDGLDSAGGKGQEAERSTDQLGTPGLDLKDQRFNSKDAAAAAGLSSSNSRDIGQADELLWKGKDNGLDLDR